MKKINTKHYISAGCGRAPGFTLIELLVAMAVAAVALGSIYAIYVTATRSYSVQRELANMQQNLRAAMYLIKNDLRNCGRDGLMSGVVGISNISRFNPDADDANGYPGITMTSFFDDTASGVANRNLIHTISYQVMDSDGDGRRELRRQETFSTDPNPGPWVLVCDGIEDISFAYAYDNDNDLDLDRIPVAGTPGTVIWAINTDNAVGLDTNVDNIPDGDINENDDGDDDGWIDSADGGLGTQIPLADIRVVRIWLLARSRSAYPNYTDTHTYVLGHKVIDMTQPAYANRQNFRHKLLMGAVSLQNHQWKP